jgi:chromosome partitioning protein
MNKIAVISEKGGVGKTTISLDLAVAASRKGNLAAVLDVDPQSTASRWTDRRKGETPWVVPTHAVRLGAAIRQAQAQGVQFLVIDTPPHSSTEALEAARQAETVLVPVEPHVFSLETVAKAADLLKLAGNPLAFFIINKAPVQGSESAAAVAFITEQGFKVCPVVIHQRAAHRHASNVGQVAAEFDGAGKAASETLDLYNFVVQMLNTTKRKTKNA